MRGADETRRFIVVALLVALIVEQMTLPLAPDGRTPFVQVLVATVFYALGLLLASAKKFEADEHRRIPIFGVPTGLWPFAVLAALFGLGCAWVSRDLTAAEHTMVWALPFVSGFGALVAWSILEKIKGLARFVGLISKFGILAVGLGNFFMHQWLPDLNSMVKWWVVLWTTTVVAGFLARHESSDFRPSKFRIFLWLSPALVLPIFGMFGVMTKFESVSARSATGWSIAALSVHQDLDRDGFYAEPQGTDCDDADGLKHPASMRKPCQTGLEVSAKPSASTRTSDHVFVFVIDAMRADILKQYPDKFPNLNSLAQKSVVFENAYSPGNATLMSLPSMLTGVTPVAMQDAMMRPDLKIKHYQEGRWIFDLDPRACGAMIVQAHDYADWLFKAYPKPEITLFFTDVTATGHGAPNAVRRFEDALEKCADRRKTFVVYLDDPHIEDDLTYRCKDGSTGGFECYLDEVEVVDEALGKMFAQIWSRPKMERTTVIVTSDHGEAFGEHGHVVHASSVYDEQVRVPLLIYQPWRKPQTVDVPVTTLGLAATVAEETHANRPAQFYPSILRAADEGTYPPPIAYNWVGLAKLAWTAPSAVLVEGDKKTYLDFVTGRTFACEGCEESGLYKNLGPEFRKNLLDVHGTLMREAQVHGEKK